MIRFDSTFLYFVYHIYILRLYDHERKKANAARSELRSLAHGTGDRSDKIRTYNFPQDRVTDHRIGLTVQGIDRVMSGLALDGFLHQLVATDETQRLETLFKSIESGNGIENHTNKHKHR